MNKPDTIKRCENCGIGKATETGWCFNCEQNRRLAEGVANSYQNHRSKCCEAKLRLDHDGQWYCKQCGKLDED